MNAQHEPDGPYDPRSWAGSPYAPSHGYPYYGQPYSDPPAGGQGGQPFGPPLPTPPKRRRRLALAVGVALVAIMAVFVAGLATGTNTVNGTPVASEQTPSTGRTGGVPTVPGPFGNGSTRSPNSSGRPTTSSGHATAKQTVGVVDIYTRLGFQAASAAGTGMILNSSGYVLTNNHVIDGATTVRVVVVSTGTSYRATVVGTAPTEDVAVLKMTNAATSASANFGNSDSVQVDDPVTGVGNAGGVGGTPSAATGRVTSLHNTITASDESGSNPERLTGIIASSAPIRSGDSGGPLYNGAGEVIGIDTAASSHGQAAGFAIPINRALSVAAEIRKGVETSVIHIGYPAFLGVSLSQQATNGAGALIGSVIAGLPADKAGIVAGDVVTKVNKTSVANYSQLRKAVAKLNPGDRAMISYTDQAGRSHRANVTLITGPAD
ncbi:MAG: S1C family serine protease [Actinomycetota bacterium]|nr:S1C family serine protease [Actinomycetota bacterium]